MTSSRRLPGWPTNGNKSSDQGLGGYDLSIVTKALSAKEEHRNPGAVT
jgi:hypothetical protein